MEFLETGEKIQRTRKLLNMKQRELEDKNITRALISMIEIGKRNPSKENMENILNKFRSKAEELKTPFDLDASYFLRSAKEDAEIYCTEALNGTDSTNEIIDITEIAGKYDLTEILSDAYLKLADKSFGDLDYINAQVSYINALENYKSIDAKYKIPYIYNMLGRCFINQAQNIQALNYFNFAYHYSSLYGDEETKKKSIYNIALCNKKLGKTDDVLKYIDIYISICDKQKDFLVYSYANIIRANCYDLQGRLTTAIEVLHNLLKEVSDKSGPLAGNIYNNLGVMYCKQGYFDKSLQYLEISENIRREKDQQNLSHTLLEKALLYINQEKYSDSISIINSVIELAAEYNDTEYILRGHYELIKIYKHLGFDKEIEDTYLQALNLIIDSGSQNYKDDVIKICIELMRIFIADNDTIQLSRVLNILENTTTK